MECDSAISGFVRQIIYESTNIFVVFTANNMQQEFICVVADIRRQPRAAI
jgi:hypothetical protein